MDPAHTLVLGAPAGTLPRSPAALLALTPPPSFLSVDNFLNTAPLPPFQSTGSRKQLHRVSHSAQVSYQSLAETHMLTLQPLPPLLPQPQLLEPKLLFWAAVGRSNTPQKKKEKRTHRTAQQSTGCGGRQTQRHIWVSARPTQRPFPPFAHSLLLHAKRGWLGWFSWSLPYPEFLSMVIGPSGCSWPVASVSDSSPGCLHSIQGSFPEVKIT